MIVLMILINNLQAGVIITRRLSALVQAGVIITRRLSALVHQYGELLLHQTA